MPWRIKSHKCRKGMTSRVERGRRREVGGTDDGLIPIKVLRSPPRKKGKPKINRPSPDAEGCQETKKKMGVQATKRKRTSELEKEKIKKNSMGVRKGNETP